MGDLWALEGLLGIGPMRETVKPGALLSERARLELDAFEGAEILGSGQFPRH